MKTRIIHTRIWKDEYFSNLNIKEKIVFIYLLTNENINLCGIYELPDKYICFDTGVSQSDLIKIKNKFMESGKIIFFNGWVKISNHEKYNTNYSGSKNEVAFQREISTISESVLKELDRLSIDYQYPSDSTINHKSKIINNKSETFKSNNKELTQKDLEDISEQLSVSLSDVQFCRDSMLDWLASSGKIKKDYVATLRNWVRRELQDGKIKRVNLNSTKFDIYGNVIKEKI